MVPGLQNTIYKDTIMTISKIQILRTIKRVLTNIEKCRLDVDGTLVEKLEGGETTLTMLGKAIVEAGVAVRALTVSSYLNKTTLSELGFNVAEVVIPNLADGTLVINFETGEQTKTVGDGEYLVDDYYGETNGRLIHYSEGNSTNDQSW